MRPLDYLQTAQNNLFRAKVRTTLTLLAVTVGTFTLAMTTAVGEGVQQYIDQQTRSFAQPDSLLVSSAQSFENPFSSEPREYDPDKRQQTGQVPTLNNADLSRIASVDGIDDAYANYSVVPDYIQYNDGKRLEATVEPFYPRSKFDLAAGNMPNSTDRSALLLPFTYVSALGFNSPDDAIGKQITLNLSRPVPNAPAETRQERVTVRGVLVNSLAGGTSYVAYDLVQELASFQQPGGASTFFGAVASLPTGTDEATISRIKGDLAERGYAAITYEEQIGQFKSAISIAQTALSFFAAIALIAATIGIVNTLLMAIFERTQEIGLMKALGMRGSGIFTIFSVEAASIGFWGGLIGVILAYLAGMVANGILSDGILKDFDGFALFSFPLDQMALIVLGATIVGLLAGTLPAIKASRLNPIDALRTE